MTSKSLEKIETQTLPEVVTPQMAVLQAYEKGADPEVLEKLLNLQERFEEREAKKAFIQAMNKFQANIPVIKKDRHVNFKNKDGRVTDYKHVSLHAISQAVSPVLAQFDLSYRWDVANSKEEVIVTCVVEHAAGHQERTTLAAGKDISGGKNSIQGVGSTVTYLQRYTLVAGLGLSIDEMEDNDGNGFGGANGPINEVQKAEIIKLIKETGTDTAQFLKFIKQDSVDSIPSGQFDRVIEALQKKRNKQNANS